MRRRDLLALGAAFTLPAPMVSLPAAAQGAAPQRKHALSLLAEPSLPRDFPHWPWANPDAPKGGEMALTALGSFDSFSHFILRGTPANGLPNLYDTLLADSADEANTEYGHLAETIEIPADGLGVAFELRDGARWHDGKPITAEDVVFTFNILREQGRPFYRAYWGDVTEIRAASPKRVEFKFRSNENRELSLILGQIQVLPKHWWEGRDFSKPSLDIPLGSGPYKIDRFDPGRSIVYRRVPDYWGKDLGTRRGTNNVDTIRYEYFRDSAVALEAFKAGQIDLRTENVAKDWATAYDFPAVRRGLVKRDELRHELPTGMQCFAMNLRRPLFQDRRVRQALGELFDFEWMNANLFYGSYTRTTSYFSNSDFAATELPSKDELAILEKYRGKVPDEVFTTVYKPPVTDGSGNNREGLRKALDLFRQAGWTVKERRLVNAQGQNFSFEILLNGPSLERLALPYKQALERLGIEVRVRTVDPAQYQVRMDNFDFDMTVDVIGQSLSPGNEQRDYWTSEKAKEPGSQNLMGIADPVIDELVEMIISAPDRQALITRTRALDRVLQWNYFSIPQYHSRSFRLAWWDKFGRPPRNPKYGLGIDTWWVDSAKEAALNAAKSSL
ncbi:ABC transporter substrate-binding protein [Acetobacteraceae bacterium H6797]|nr:ABC transporter substrate-binding protein [Acetobacteraceae bacterium H6797]